MRVAVAVCLALLLSTEAALAEDAVGVVVSGGGPTIRADVFEFISVWLGAHGHRLAETPMNNDAVTSLANCLVLEDMKCARGVIDARSSATNIIYARIDVPAKGKTTLAFTAYWFVKNHPAVAERRVCADCVGAAWQPLIDDLLAALAKTPAVKTGHLKVESDPTGLTVLLDNQAIGVTPLERDIATGAHRITVAREGRKVASQRVAVLANETAAVEFTADVPAPELSSPPGWLQSSRAIPATLVGVGVAALTAGSVFLYYGSLSGPTHKYTYGESTPIGIGFLALGLGATIGGTILLLQSGHSAGPVASVAPGGGYVGWIGRF